MIDRKRIRVALFIVGLSILASVFARGMWVSLFYIPFFLYLLYRRHLKVLLNKEEGNILAAFLVIIFIPLFFTFDVFVMALYFLLALLSVKLFVSGEGKDFDQLVILSFLVFSLSSVFLYSLWYLVLFIAFMFFLSLYLALRQIPAMAVDKGNILLHLFYIVPSIELFALLLFFFLPRNPSMLFGYNPEYREVQFDDIKVGGFEKEQFSNRVLLRAIPLKKESPFLYLRMRSFAFFDGVEWRGGQKWYNYKKGRILFTCARGYTERYRILLSARFSYLPLVDYPVLLLLKKEALVDLPDCEVKLKGGQNFEKTYFVFSSEYPGSSFNGRKIPGVAYLYVPDSLKHVLDSILGNIEFSEDTLFSLLNYLRARHSYGAFSYKGKAVYPIEVFLSRSSPGECTEFATSFALLARMLGYKTRLVAGFLSKEYNKIGGYFIIKEKDAHTWVEVYKNGVWVRYDPTPFVKNSAGFLSVMSIYLDYLQYLWFTKVVEYSYRDQTRILIKTVPYFYKIKEAILLVTKRLCLYFVLFMAFLLSFVLYLRGAKDPYKPYRKMFLKYMRKKGFSLRDGQTLGELAEESDDEKAKKFVKLYYSARYGFTLLKDIKEVLKKTL